MTSVPKPLKFLHPHYPELQLLYEAWPRSDDKSMFADILSVLAMTYSDTQPRGTLRYRLLAAQLLPEGSTSLSEPGSWGHEFVRHLASELSEEYTFREQEEQLEMKTTVGSIDDLKLLATQCAAFLLGHNAEPDAVDLLQELEIADSLVDLVDENTYARVCLYIIRYALCTLSSRQRVEAVFQMCKLPATPGRRLFPRNGSQYLRETPEVARSHRSRYPTGKTRPDQKGLRFPREPVRIPDPFLGVYWNSDVLRVSIMKRQLALILARAQTPLEWLQVTDEDGDIEELPEDIVECLSNSRLSTQFKEFGKELGVLEPKSLEDVYKSHLENARTTSNVDSARGNLASTFVNAFTNAGFGNDKLMVEAEEGNSWIYKNKDHGSSRSLVRGAALNRSIETLRDDERCCQLGAELVVGH